MALANTTKYLAAVNVLMQYLSPLFLYASYTSYMLDDDDQSKIKDNIDICNKNCVFVVFTQTPSSYHLTT